MKSNKFSITQRIKSFKYAINGLNLLFKEEHNARVHAFVALIVITVGFYFEISALEWIAVLFAIGFVITTEILNTCIENLADFISPERNEKIKVIKDIAAAAVLLSTITAIVIGLIIFLPKCLTLFDRF